jgi:hypothetical protein
MADRLAHCHAADNLPAAAPAFVFLLPATLGFVAAAFAVRFDGVAAGGAGLARCSCGFSCDCDCDFSCSFFAAAVRFVFIVLTLLGEVWFSKASPPSGSQGASKF